MTFNWKHSARAFALSVAMLAPISGQIAEAKPVETGQLLIKDRVKPSVEKGIKDNGVKSCGSCGMTGKKAAPPAVDGGAAPAPSVDVETGQLLDKGPRWPHNKVAEKEAAPPATDDGAAPPSEEKVETGQLLDKGPRWPNNKATERRAHSGPGGTPPSIAKNALCGLPYTPPCVTDATAKKGANTGLILGITAGAAALAAVLASGNNDDRPTSP